MKLKKSKNSCHCDVKDYEIRYKYILDDIINLFEDNSLSFEVKYDIFLFLKGVVNFANNKKNNN